MSQPSRTCLDKSLSCFQTLSWRTRRSAGCRKSPEAEAEAVEAEAVEEAAFNAEVEDRAVAEEATEPRETSIPFTVSTSETSRETSPGLSGRAFNRMVGHMSSGYEAVTALEHVVVAEDEMMLAEEAEAAVMLQKPRQKEKNPLPKRILAGEGEAPEMALASEEERIENDS